MSICLRLGLGLALGFRISVECAFVVFALVVERVQDTVVRVLGFRPSLVCVYLQRRTDIHTDRHAGIHTFIQAYIQADIHADRRTDRYTDRHTYKQA